MAENQLPASVSALLDGTDLESRVGVTVQLVVAEPEGWPRVASLSVGEVLAAGPRRLLLTMYDKSRTTRALFETGKGLLMLVDDGAIVKIQIDATEISDAKTPGRTTFQATVVAVERDEVPYARVTHGVEFALVDGTGAVARWRRQLADLREASVGGGHSHRGRDAQGA
jgi:hypothetical protein